MKISRVEGVPALWRGLPPTLFVPGFCDIYIGVIASGPECRKDIGVFGLPPKMRYPENYLKLNQINSSLIFAIRVMAVPATVLYYVLYDKMKAALASREQWAPLIAGSVSRGLLMRVKHSIALMQNVSCSLM